jgi:hypothetical protein
MKFGTMQLHFEKNRIPSVVNAIHPVVVNPPGLADSAW